jgi:hypothetical protein
MKIFKKNYGLIIILTLIPTFSYSEISLQDASKDYILNLFELCKAYAEEDRIAVDKVNNYVLTCINDELKEDYYNSINSLPKASSAMTNL